MDEKFADTQTELLDDLPAITVLAKDLELALVVEYTAKTDAQIVAENSAERKAHVLLEAYRAKAITGKNADIRRLEEMYVLAKDPIFQAFLVRQKELELYAAVAEAERKAHDALIGLTKAWLYSQSGR